jgi:hypothetical protein
MHRESPDAASLDWHAREGIRTLFAQYAWSFDTGDLDGYVSTFTHDGVLDLPDGQFVGHAQIRAYAASVFADPNFVGRQHFVGQSLFVWSQRGWTVRSYALITQRVPASPPGIVSAGQYLDECVSSPTGWLFARRTYRRWGDDALSRLQIS